MKSKRLNGVLTFLAATAGEFIALFYWFWLFRAGYLLWAVLALWAGFILERGAVVLYLRMPGEIPYKTGRVMPLFLFLFVVTVGEIITWLVWIYLSAHVGYLGGAAVFGFLIHLIHSYEAAVILKGSLRRMLLNLGTLALSLVETAGAFGWIYFTDRQHAISGAGILLGSLFLEHTLQVAGLSAGQTRRNGAGL